MVTQAQVLDGLATYIESVILPTLDGWRIWAARAALVLVYQNANTVLPEMLNSKPIKMLGLVDGDGMIDIDKALSAANETVQKYGSLEVDVPGFGAFRFDQTDFNKLSNFIKQSNA